MRFGDMVTAGTSEVEGATTPERYALIVLDRATKWLESRPMKEHNTDNVVAALKHIVADDETVNVLLHGQGSRIYQCSYPDGMDA